MQSSSSIHKLAYDTTGCHFPKPVRTHRRPQRAEHPTPSFSSVLAVSQVPIQQATRDLAEEEEILRTAILFSGIMHLPSE